MASLTIAIDPEILEAAKLEAVRRQTSLDQLVADLLKSVSATEPPRHRDNSALLRLMERGPLGDIGKPLTREEIYAERTWPRS
jgi:DNA topoisomerase IA